MPRLYDNNDSGNCYKIRLLLAQLGVHYERIELDTERGQTRTAEFLEKNPNGRVPVLETSDGRYLSESGAILWHLSEGSDFLPSDSWHRGKVLQWMFFEQYSHEPYVAVIRHWSRGGHHRANKEQWDDKVRQGYAALSVMETHLASTPFFVAERYTVADIALFAYTHVAHEGGFSLEKYPNIRKWLVRVSDQPGHVGMFP